MLIEQASRTVGGVEERGTGYLRDGLDDGASRVMSPGRHHLDRAGGAIAAS